jgi:cyclopropane fatty-acyl-phospholipid synthase-like methyltransferase
MKEKFMFKSTLKLPVPPNKSTEFDHAYQSPIMHWVWSDVRIPQEIKALVQHGNPRSVLELGCGLGIFSRYVAQQGLCVTGVDFSPVAIAKARERVTHDDLRPEFLVGDVTHLDALNGPFDISFDVGCFHCLDSQGQRAYMSEVSRLLKPGGTHLIWALDSSPSNIPLSPAVVKKIFAPDFELQKTQKSRRRLILTRSHWYWVVRR